MANKLIELLIAAKDGTKAAFSSVTGKLNKLEKSAKSIKSLGSVVTGLFAGYGALRSFQSVIQKTKEQEAALKQVEQRLKSTEGASQQTIESLSKTAEELQKITTYGDEAILKMQSVLLTFTNIQGNTFNKATEAILDLSVAMGQDLKSSAVQLGKALNDPITGLNSLSRIGVKFTETQKEQIKYFAENNQLAKAQAIILKELNVEFGGAAKAAADTFGGALDQLSNAWGDLLEGKGGLDDGKKSIQDLTKILQDPATKSAFDKLTSAVIGSAATFAKATTEVVQFTQAIGELLAGATGAKDGTDELNSLTESYSKSLKTAKEELQSMYDAGLDATAANVQAKQAEIDKLQSLINLTKQYNPAEESARHLENQKEVAKQIEKSAASQAALTEEIKKSKQAEEDRKASLKSIQKILDDIRKTENEREIAQNSNAYGAKSAVDNLEESLQKLKEGKATSKEVSDEADKAYQTILEYQKKSADSSIDKNYAATLLENLKEAVSGAKRYLEGDNGNTLTPALKPKIDQEYIKNLATEIKDMIQGELNQAQFKIKVQAEIDKASLSKQALKKGTKA